MLLFDVQRGHDTMRTLFKGLPLITIVALFVAGCVVASEPAPSVNGAVSAGNSEDVGQAKEADGLPPCYNGGCPYGYCGPCYDQFDPGSDSTCYISSGCGGEYDIP
jgi:hypothetical protein